MAMHHLTPRRSVFDELATCAKRKCSDHGCAVPLCFDREVVPRWHVVPKVYCTLKETASSYSESVGINRAIILGPSELALHTPSL
jgi:hypothetical protein